MLYGLQLFGQHPQHHRLELAELHAFGLGRRRLRLRFEDLA
jgi:hypothetical protein